MPGRPSAIIARWIGALVTWSAIASRYQRNAGAAAANSAPATSSRIGAASAAAAAHTSSEPSAASPAARRSRRANPAWSRAAAAWASSVNSTCSNGMNTWPGSAPSCLTARNSPAGALPSSAPTTTMSSSPWVRLTVTWPLVASMKRTMPGNAARRSPNGVRAQPP